MAGLYPERKVRYRRLLWPWEPLGDVDELNVNAVPRHRRMVLLGAVLLGARYA
jgi:hypothetical protein